MSANTSANSLEAGFAAVDITPPVGLFMCGSLDPRTNEGVDDPLKATAMVVGSGKNAACIVQVDLIGLPRSICDATIERACSKTGIHPDAIMISCTHTHSGPYTKNGLYSMDVTDDEYLGTLPELISSAIAGAFDARQPVSMHIGRSLVYYGLHYRRVKTKDGMVYNSWMGDALNDLTTCPQVVGCAGPIDPELWVLRFDDAKGETIGAFVNFTCHVNSHFGTKYSADYPAVIAQRLSDEFGKGVTTVFTPGACANINPTRPGLDWRQGAEWFADEAVAAAKRATPVEGPMRVSFARRDVRVPRRDPDSNPPGAIDRLNWGGKGGRSDVFDRQRKFIAGMPEELSVPVNVIGIGPFAVASNAGELFVEHGLAIKQESPFPHTVVAELTNDLIMYQPTREAFEQQGYETLVGPNRVSIEGIESLVGTAIEMLTELRPADGQ